MYVFRSRRTVWYSVLCSFSLLLALGCGKNGDAPEPAASAAEDDFKVQDDSAGKSKLSALAAEVCADVGRIRIVSSKGTVGPILVFEEFHTSRLGQLEIAVMLNRLYEREGLRVIGLEGAIHSSRPLDAKWFHEAGGDEGGKYRQDVAIRMLAEGEISSAEFMAMAYPAVKVHGIELKEEYDHNLDMKGSPEGAYLLQIAQQSLSQDDIRKANGLVNDKKEAEAIEFIMNADPWVQKHYQALKSSSGSVEKIAGNLREIQAKADSVGASIPADIRESMAKSIRFFEVASHRSDTMVKNMLPLARSSTGKASAMIIGAAHSERVEKLLRDAGASFAIIRPTSFNPEKAALTTEQFEQKGRNKWVRSGDGTLGALLNAKRKPQPLIETATAKSWTSAKLTSLLLAQAVRDGKRPVDMQKEIDQLPEITVDWKTLRVDGFDVIFAMALTQTDGSKTKVWAPGPARTLRRVGKIGRVAPGRFVW